MLKGHTEIGTTTSTKDVAETKLQTRLWLWSVLYMKKMTFQILEILIQRTDLDNHTPFLFHLWNVHSLLSSLGDP
jgi:hypothetical protein